MIRIKLFGIRIIFKVFFPPERRFKLLPAMMFGYIGRRKNHGREEVADLREKLAASMQEAEIHKRQVEKHYELDTEYYDFYIKAVKSLLKEKNGG